LGVLLALAGVLSIIKFSTMSPDAQAVMAAERSGSVQAAVAEDNLQAPTTPGNPAAPVNPVAIETH
jgi:hypothetical protein